MIPQFPFFQSPMYYNSSYGNPYHSSKYNYYKNTQKNKAYSSCINSNATTNSKNTSSTEINNSSKEQFWEIFGIKLYFDDILIICLIFFLYTQDVNDPFLFIALLLLLLS